MKKRHYSSHSQRKHAYDVSYVLGLCIVLSVAFFLVSNLRVDRALSQGASNSSGNNGGFGGIDVIPGGGNGKDGKENGNNGRGGTELCGFAWSGTAEAPYSGAGWVSFSSRDCDTNNDGITGNEGAGTIPGCPTSGRYAPYGVYIGSDNTLNGYAWSSNIGWIKFGGLTGQPSSSLNPNSQVKISGQNLSGWIRACAGTVGGTCGTMNARSDGWDGWISLLGYGYSVKYDQPSRKFSGYSWGGPVIGWLKWDSTSSSGVRFCSVPTLAAGITASPSSGTSPLNGVDLTASIGGTATGNSTVKFDCTNNGSYESTVSDVTGSTYTATDLCNYSSPGTYTAKVEVTRDGITSTATTPIQVNAPQEPPTGEISATCTVTTPVIVNTPSTWTVTLESQDALPPFTYKFTFDDGQPNPSDIISSNTSVNVDRTFSTVGSKNLRVDVVDSRSTPATGFCTVKANVIVRPVIIET